MTRALDQKKFRHIVQAAAVLLLMAVALGAASVRSAERVKFDIEAQQLSSALSEFALQSGKEILFIESETAAKQVVGLKGSYTPEAALDLLLKNTSLEYRVNQLGTLLVGAAAAPSGPARGKSRPAPGETLLAQNRTPAAQTQTRNAENNAYREESSPILEEVYVTATKRTVNIQKLAQSIHSLSGAVLEATGAENFEDFTYQIAGLNMSGPGEAGNKAVNIRGISPLGNGDSDFATVGFYIDETPISDASTLADFALFDVDRVEVLRGPQGTLFGEGSLGGTVRILSNRPNPEEFQGKVEASYSKVSEGGNAHRLMGMLNVPLGGNRAAARVVAGTIDSGGFIDNIRTGNEDINANDIAYLRGAMAFEASDKLDIFASVIFQNTDGKGSAYDETDTPDLTQDRAIDGDYEDDNLLASVIIDYDLGWATLTSATSYYDRETYRQLDLTPVTFQLADLFGIPESLAQVLLPSGSIETDDSTTETFSQEIRLVSTTDGAIDWLIGGFYRERDNFLSAVVEQNELPILTGGFLGADIFDIAHDSTFEHTAVFGEATYHLSERSHLTGGFRYFRESISSQATLEIGALGTGVIPSTTDDDESDLQLKFAYSYELTDDAMVYLSYSEGFRPGGFNFRILVPTIPRTFSSDTTESIEIGAKTTWGGPSNNVTLNIAAYRTDWTDAQLADFTLGGANFTFNAGEVEVNGAEIEVAARLVDRLELGFNLSYNDSELKEDTFSEATGQQLAAAGEVLPFAPEITYNLYASYEFPLTSALAAFARLDFSYIDDFNSEFGLANAASTLPSYELLNLRAGVRTDTWSVTAFVDNVSDERAILNIREPTQVGYLRNQPRSIGLTLRADF